MMQPIRLDDLISTGMQQAMTVDAILQQIMDDPKLRDAVQVAIDNPPPTQVKGRSVMGASHAQHIRQAILTVLGATA
jgi:hypothetical protein